MALVPTKTEFVVTPRDGVMDTQVRTAPTSTVLSEAAAVLGVGDVVAFPCPGLEPFGGAVGNPLHGVQWANRWHYDHDALRGVMMGKDAQSQGSRRYLAAYNEPDNLWSYAAFNAGGELGHVYESFAFDPADWSVYTGYWDDGSTLQRWTYPAPLYTWSWPVCDHLTTIGDDGDETGAVQGMVVWHPNLYGSGDGGIVAASFREYQPTGSLVAWRKSSGAPGTWTDIAGTTHAVSGSYPGRGSACYVRAWDTVIYSLQALQGGRTFVVPAGADGAVSAAFQIADPPIPCGWTRDSQTVPDNVGFLIDDPTGTGGPYLFEKLREGGGDRYWRLSAAFEWTEIGEHPFPPVALIGGVTDNWVLASCYPYGVFWMLARGASSTSAHSWLWRPGDQ